jgi:hypothetical protein
MMPIAHLMLQCLRSLPAVLAFCCSPIRPDTRTPPCPGMYRIAVGELRKEQPLRIPRAAPLQQPERGRTRRRGLIRTLADTFRNDIGDQEVCIN